MEGSEKFGPFWVVAVPDLHVESTPERPQRLIL